MKSESALGSLGGARELSRVVPNLAAAKTWLEIGTAAGWSLTPVLFREGNLGFGIFSSNILQKATSSKKLAEDALKFANEKKCNRFFLNELKITESEVCKISLQKVTALIPLPCEAVLNRQLREEWKEKTGTYRESKLLDRRVAAAAEGQYSDFQLLVFWSSHSGTIANFIAGLAEIEPKCMTRKGLARFSAYFELLNRFANREPGGLEGSSELCSMEELGPLNYLPEARFRDAYQEKNSSQGGKVTRAADDHFATFLARAFDVTSHCESAALSEFKNCFNEDDFEDEFAAAEFLSGLVEFVEERTAKRVPLMMPTLSEREICRFAMYFGKVFAGSLSNATANWGSFHAERVKLTANDFLRFGVDFVLQVANKFAYQPFNCEAAERATALQSRQKVASWAYLSKAFAQTEYVPLFPSILCDGANITPAMLKTELAVLRKPEQKKCLALEAIPWLTCEDFLTGRVSFDFWESPAGRTVPFVAEQMLTGLLKLVQAMPGIYQNFGFLHEGKVNVSNDAEAVLREFDEKTLKVGSEPKGYTVGFTSPFAVPVGTRLNLPTFDRNQFPISVHELEFVNMLHRQTLRLNVNFRPKSSEKGRASLQAAFATLLKAIAASSAKTRSEILQGSTPASLPDLSDIEYEPVFTFEAEGKVFSETEWLAAKKTKAGYLLSDGSLILKASYESCLEIFHHRQRALVRFGRLSLRDLWKASRISTAAFDQKLEAEQYLGYLQTQLQGFGDEIDAEFVRGLTQLLEGAEYQGEAQPAPSKLRPYQTHGVSWVLSRFALGLGACLADEMGLGKTAQALQVIRLVHRGFLPTRQRSGSSSHRSLVVCPKTLGLNWVRECGVWAPDLKVQFIEGQAIDADTDIVVTTYPRLRLREQELAAECWNCVVLDEAHNIKNHTTAQARVARQIQARYRLALTGTPLENHPRELWSLLDWLNEGWLGDVGSFDSYTRLARSAEEKTLMLAPLRSMIGPVLLRRCKADPQVALDLPDKIERMIELELSNEQKALYEAVVLAALGAQSDDMAVSSFQRSAGYLKAILHAKQICNHPDNFLVGDEDDEILENGSDVPSVLTQKITKAREREAKSTGLKNRGATASLFSSENARSTKLQALLELLLELQEAEGGILIFTQFKQSAAIIRQAIAHLAEEQGIENWLEVPYLGSALSTAEREAAVADFQFASEASRQSERRAKGAPPILVLSLKTGGVGLNLTGATQVIHFDRWWNPAVEAQATDRAHRIGQERKVTVTHFCAVGTVEEGIAKLMASKRLLAHDFLAESTAEGARDFLREDSGFLRLVDPQGRFTQKRFERFAKSETSVASHAPSKRQLASHQELENGAAP